MRKKFLKAYKRIKIENESVKYFFNFSKARFTPSRRDSSVKEKSFLDT